MAQANEQANTGQPAVATHQINGTSKQHQRRANPKNQRANQSRDQNQRKSLQFYPDESTALPGTSHYSSAVVYKDIVLRAVELQRAHHRHTEFVGSIIHQLENATLSKYREKNIDLVREAIDKVYDRLDSMEVEINKQKAEMSELLKDTESHYEGDNFSNPLKYDQIPIQTMGGIKWLELLVSADELIDMFYQSMFAPKAGMDGIERHTRVNELVKLFNKFPNFASETNKEVGVKVNEIGQAEKRASGAANSAKRESENVKANKGSDQSE